MKLITPEEGPVFLVDELIHGRKGETEIVIAGGAEQASRPPRNQQRSTSPELKVEIESV
jgi:hypothetical protein